MKKSILLASLVAAVALAACGKKADEPVNATAPMAASEAASAVVAAASEVVAAASEVAAAASEAASK